MSICNTFTLYGTSSKRSRLARYGFDRSINQNRPEYIANWPGFFRFLTLIAFRYFLSEHVDVVILEVGMGGRLDCTNVISSALTTGITLIDLEHTEILGHTLSAIAFEKGGIFKPGAPAVVLRQSEEVLETLRRCADDASRRKFRPFSERVFAADRGPFRPPAGISLRGNLSSR